MRTLAAISQALQHRDDMLHIVGEAEDRDRAREALMAGYGWDKVEVTAVLDLRLQQAACGERERIAQELHEARVRLKTGHVR